MVDSRLGCQRWWVSGHAGIRGNGAADRTAKEALDKDRTDDLLPSSDVALM